MPKIFVQTRREPHLSTVFVGAKLEDAAEVCRENKYGKVAVVFSENTDGHARRLASALASSGVPHCEIRIDDGEKSKTIKTADALWSALCDAGLDRHSAVIAVGGGVLGDVAGFAASTFMRGIPVVQVPTTLLAMVDSSVGGKTGVNLSGNKNLVGTFHPPDAVVIDFSTLDTLPESEFRQGLAEVVKAGCIADPKLFEHLEREHEKILRRDPDALSRAVEAALRVKADIVGKDPAESRSASGKTSRMLLNLGHTAGHALESLSNYSIRHGDAVSMGLVAACRVSEELADLDPAEGARIERLLSAFGLPTKAPGMDVPKILEKMRQDKKNRAGAVTMVLLESIGRPKVVRDVPQDAMARALKKIVS